MMSSYISLNLILTHSIIELTLPGDTEDDECEAAKVPEFSVPLASSFSSFSMFLLVLLKVKHNSMNL